MSQTSAPLPVIQECDLVMKGGITSGVVYPHAIANIAREYRLRSIGGSSAGAIATCFAAAAEYRRQATGGQDSSGFDQIAEVGSDLAKSMSTLFQPYPNLTPLYELLLTAIRQEDGEDRKSETTNDNGKPQ